jgi:hypothetical protein
MGRSTPIDDEVVERLPLTVAGIDAELAATRAALARLHESRQAHALSGDVEQIDAASRSLAILEQRVQALEQARTAVTQRDTEAADEAQRDSHARQVEAVRTIEEDLTRRYSGALRAASADPTPRRLEEAHLMFRSLYSCRSALHRATGEARYRPTSVHTPRHELGDVANRCASGNPMTPKPPIDDAAWRDLNP